MRKVSAGDYLSIAARDWNTLSDIANANASGAVAGDGLKLPTGMGTGWIWVKNVSGADRSRFDCMSLDDLVNELEFNAHQDVIFQCTAADPDKAPAILLEPIANNRVGRACIYGMTLAKVAAGTSTTLLRAKPNAAGNNLIPSTSGPVKLLKAPSTTEELLLPVVIDDIGGGGATVEFEIASLRTAAAGGADAPYTGLKIATVTITRVPCDRQELLDTTVDVVDHSGCVFDLPEADLIGVRGWASEGLAISLDSAADPGTLTPCHWCADDRCCTGSEGGSSSVNELYVGTSPPSDTGLVWIDTSGI